MYILKDYYTNKQIGKHGFETQEEAEQYKRAYLNMMWKEKHVHNNLINIVEEKKNYGQISVDALRRMK